jgi:hypothetical protein
VDAGLVQAASNLGYWIAALMLPVVAAGTPVPFEHQVVLYSASALESFTGGLGTAAFLAFLMAIVRKDRAATGVRAALVGVRAVALGRRFRRRAGRAVDGLRELVPAHVLPRAAVAAAAAVGEAHARPRGAAGAADRRPP